MTVAADIIVYGAGRIGSAVSWALAHAVEIIAALGGWAIFTAWVMTGRSKIE